MLPSFTVDGYKNLVDRVVSDGFQVKPVSAMPVMQENCIYFRHDLDFSVVLSTPIAEIENAAGITATYFVLLSGHYNPFHQETVAAIKTIKRLGHEIGLHYDLKNWPANIYDATKKLKNEIEMLESITESKVESIVMHEPFRGGDDFFAIDPSILGLVNPTFFQKNYSNLCYVSDSCRAWRDENLLRFMERSLPQKSLMLNTHPELWLATRKKDRINYLESELAPAAMKSIREYYTETVKSVWETHHAAVNGFGDECDD